MTKNQIANVASANGIRVSYSGKTGEMHFHKGEKSVSRRIDNKKPMTQKMLSNTFKKLD